MCFNPYISLTTFAIEAILALYVFLKFKKSPLRNLGALMLLTLGLYQLGEGLACSSLAPQITSRIGYAMTALLPAMGVHLALLLSKRKASLLLHVPAIAFFLAIIGTDTLITGSVCHQVFVEYFYAGTLVSTLYGIYYTTFMATMAFILAFYGVHENDAYRRKTLYLGSFAVAAFVLPTYVYTVAIQDAAKVFASSLCHFAILFAIVMFVVLRRSEKLTN